MSTKTSVTLSPSLRTARPSSSSRKADLKPGDKKYQEVTAVQVTERMLAAVRRPRRHQGAGGRPSRSKSVSG